MRATTFQKEYFTFSAPHFCPLYTTWRAIWPIDALKQRVDTILCGLIPYLALSFRYMGYSFMPVSSSFGAMVFTYWYLMDSISQAIFHVKYLMEDGLLGYSPYTPKNRLIEYNLSYSMAREARSHATSRILSLRTASPLLRNTKDLND